MMESDDHGYAVSLGLGHSVRSGEGCCVPFCKNLTCSDVERSFQNTLQAQCVKAFSTGIQFSASTIVCGEHFKKEHFFYFGVVLGQLGGASMRDKFVVRVTADEGAQASEAHEDEEEDACDTQEDEGVDATGMWEYVGVEECDTVKREAGKIISPLQDSVIKKGKGNTKVENNNSKLKVLLKKDDTTKSVLGRSVCKICRTWCKNDYQLKKHMETHGDELKPFACEVPNCSQRFFKQVGLNSHMTTHTAKNFACIICNERFKTENLLRSHTVTHGMNYMTVACEAPLCAKVLSADELRIQAAEAKSDDAMFACLMCSKRFKLKPSLQRHIARHAKNSIKSLAIKKFFSDDSFMIETPTIDSVREDECEIEVEEIPVDKDYEIHTVLEPDTLNEGGIVYKRVMQEGGIVLYKADMQEGSETAKSGVQVVDIANLTEHLLHEEEIAVDPEISEILEGEIIGRVYDVQEAEVSDMYEIREDDLNDVCEIQEIEIEHKLVVPVAKFKSETQVNPSYEMRLYSCDVCEKRFKTKKELKRHRLRHFDNCKKFLCPEPQCNKRYLERAHLMYHIASHSDERNVSCDLCDKRYKRKHDLREHLKTHTYDDNSRKFICTIPGCTKAFNKKSILKNHLRSHLLPQFVCERCDRRFKLERSFKAHMEKCVATNTSDQLFVLNFVPTPSTVKTNPDDIPSSSELSVPSSSEPTAAISIKLEKDKSYICTVPLCSKRYHTENLLNNHINIKHSEPKFVCSTCGHRFRLELNLQAHAGKCGVAEPPDDLSAICDGEPCTCGACDYEATGSSTGARVRVKAKKYFDPSRPFVCTEAGCEKRFQWKRTLDGHMKSHAPPQFQCGECNKLFRWKSNLLSHTCKCKGTKTSFDEKHINPVVSTCGSEPCTCGSCNKRLPSYSSNDKDNTVDSNVNTCGDGLTYECSVPRCSERFTWRHHLKYHVVKNPNDERLYVFCDTCGSRFRCKDSLNVHIKQRIHGKGTCKMYTCHVPLCHEQFKWKHHLKYHIPLERAVGKK